MKESTHDKWTIRGIIAIIVILVLSGLLSNASTVIPTKSEVYDEEIMITIKDYIMGKAL